MGNKTVEADFLVIEGQGQVLLSKATSIALGLLHIGLVNNVISDEERKQNLKDHRLRAGTIVHMGPWFKVSSELLVLAGGSNS